MERENEILVVDPVVYVDETGVPRPVGLSLKKIIKKVKKAVKKIAKPLLGVVASVAIPGIGGLLANAAMTAADVAKAKKNRKNLKDAAKKAAAADAEAIKRITAGYKALKKESDEFRAARGLPPLEYALPNLKKAKPEQVEAAFVALQDDAAAILARESASKTSSTSGDVIGPDGRKVPEVGAVALAAGAAVLLGVALYRSQKRKRR